MSLSSMKSNGYIEVAKTRQDPPVKIYYELHGDGPQHVVLIMGKKRKQTETIACINQLNHRVECFLFKLGKAN